MKKKKWLIITGVFCVILLFLVFGTLKKSTVNNFPIPIIAQIDEKYSDKDFSYKFKGSNSLYVIHLKLLGWKEVNKLGSKVIFEKDGYRVALITYKDGFHIKNSDE